MKTHRALQDDVLPWEAFEYVELVVAFPQEFAEEISCREEVPRWTGAVVDTLGSGALGVRGYIPPGSVVLTVNFVGVNSGATTSAVAVAVAVAVAAVAQTPMVQTPALAYTLVD